MYDRNYKMQKKNALFFALFGLFKSLGLEIFKILYFFIFSKVPQCSKTRKKVQLGMTEVISLGPK